MALNLSSELFCVCFEIDSSEDSSFNFFVSYIENQSPLGTGFARGRTRKSYELSSALIPRYFCRRIRTH